MTRTLSSARTANVCAQNTNNGESEHAAAPLEALLDDIADRIAARLIGRVGLEASERFASAKDNPLGSMRSFQDAARRGDFVTFKRGREVVARWADVEAFILSRQCKRSARPAKVDEGDADRLELEAAGVRLRPAKGIRR